jgi:hypothetical protein
MKPYILWISPYRDGYMYIYINHRFHVVIRISQASTVGLKFHFHFREEFHGIYMEFIWGFDRGRHGIYALVIKHSYGTSQC